MSIFTATGMSSGRRIGVWSIAMRILAVVRAIRAAHERRKAARHLNELDGRMLRDIGLDRTEILSAVYGGGRYRGRRNAHD